MSIGSFNFGNYEDKLGSNLDFGASRFTPVAPILDIPTSSVLPNIDTNLNLDDYGLGPGSGHALGLSFGSGDGSIPGSFTPTFADKFWGYKDPKTGMMYDGYAKTGLGAVQAGLGFYLGKGQLDQAKKALRENQRQFNTNYAAQKATINDQLRWQHKARTDRDPTYRGQLTQIA